MPLLLLEAAHATRLDKALDKALDVPLLEGASYGIVVWDSTGTERFSRDADRRLIPASITKWITAAAAADTLGLDHHFQTRIAASGYTEAAGRGSILHGDLVVVGGGDPSLGDGDPRAILAEMISVVRSFELERIEGNIVVDPSAFDGPPYGPGWMWDDFGSAFSPPYGAANFAHNLLLPGLACEAHDGPGSPLVDPAQCLAESLQSALLQAGIPSDGAAVYPVPEAAELAVLPSPPLRELIGKMLSDSDNLYAECIVRALDPFPPREAGAAGDRIANVLRTAGVVEGGARFVDGSGLSRYSFTTADAMVRVTSWVASQEYGPELLSLLPVSGRTGTLARRMVGTPAEGRCSAKTGSMTGVRNLVGSVSTQTDEKLWFAVLLNGFAGPQADAIALQDQLIALLALSDGRKIPRRAMLAQLGEQR